LNKEYSKITNLSDKLKMDSVTLVYDKTPIIKNKLDSKNSNRYESPIQNSTQEISYIKQEVGKIRQENQNLAIEIKD